MIEREVRLVTIGLLGVLALGTGVPAEADAATTTCRVRNVTQDTRGRSFDTMVGKARDGDRLHVRGTCAAHAVIDADVLIVGVGERRAILTGGDRHGVLWVKRRADVILMHLVITGGHEHPVQFGGGISNGGTLLILDSVIRGNEDLGVGGISNGGRMTLRDSVVSGNSAASGDGGGISNSGTLTVLDSVITGNTAYWDGSAVEPSGGGIANSGTLTVRRSVIGSNHASSHGGGIYNTGDITLARSTVIGNTAFAGAGIANNWDGTVILRRSRVARNTAQSDGGGIWNGFWSPWDDDEQPDGVVAVVTLLDSVVRGNTAKFDGGGIWNHGGVTLDRSALVTVNTAGWSGGGVWNDDDPTDGVGTVTLLGGSSVTRNTPDDCVGSAAC